ncbi:MAG: hypothetical protein AAFZ91_00700 [Pseudomonadota bacterium]
MLNLFASLLSSILGRLAFVIQVPALALIGIVMTVFVGLPLAIGGRPEAIVPLFIGGAALNSLYRTFKPKGHSRTE